MNSPIESWISELYSYHATNIGKGLVLIGAMHALLLGYAIGTGDNPIIIGSHVAALTLIALFWFLREKVGIKARNLFFFIVSTIALPCVGFTILAVAAADASVGDLAFAYVALALAALFIYSVILSNIPLSAIGFVVALATGLGVVALTGGEISERVRFYTIEPIGLWLTLSLVTGVVNRNIAHAHERRVEAANSLAANLAHELRTPLTGMQVRCERTKTILSSLNDPKKDQFVEVLNEVSEQITEANVVINRVLEDASDERADKDGLFA